MKVGPGPVVATFELFNRWSAKPDWVLEATGAGARLRLTGTTTRPTLPGPSDLHVAYVDEPRGYANLPILASLRVHASANDVARVHVEGVVRVDDLTIDIELEAALVT